MALHKAYRQLQLPVYPFDCPVRSLCYVALILADEALNLAEMWYLVRHFFMALRVVLS